MPRSRQLLDVRCDASHLGAARERKGFWQLPQCPVSQIWPGVQQFSSLAPGGMLPVGPSLFKRWQIGNGAPSRPAAQTLLILINFSTINFKYHVKRGIISKEAKGPLSDIKLTFSCVLEETYRTRDHIYKCNLVSLSSSATMFASDLYKRCVLPVCAAL